MSLAPASRLFAGVTLVAAALAACGPGAATEPKPVVAPPPPPPSATLGASVAPPPAPPPVARPSGEKSTSVVPSSLGRELAALGLDPAKLPKLAQMTAAQKKGLMPLFAKTLGYAKPGDPGCTGCHVAGHFETETRNRALAREMFDRWSVDDAVVLTAEQAAARPGEAPLVFCDSCHADEAKVLDRSDTDALRAFMKKEYVDKLARHDEKPQSCASCHSSDLELAIFDRVWKVPR